MENSLPIILQKEIHIRRSKKNEKKTLNQNKIIFSKNRKRTFLIRYSSYKNFNK